MERNTIERQKVATNNPAFELGIIVLSNTLKFIHNGLNMEHTTETYNERMIVSKKDKFKLVKKLLKTKKIKLKGNSLLSNRGNRAYLQTFIKVLILVVNDRDTEIKEYLFKKKHPLKLVRNILKILNKCRPNKKEGSEMVSNMLGEIFSFIQNFSAIMVNYIKTSKCLRQSCNIIADIRHYGILLLFITQKLEHLNMTR